MKSLFRVLDRVHCQCSPRRLNLYRYYSGSSNEDATDKPTDDKKPHLQVLLDDAALGVGPLDEISEEDEWRTSPYPKGSQLHPNQSQSAKSLRPAVDPRDTSIIMFPGQGCQHVGMGRELLKFPAARDIFDACSDILEYDLVKLLLKGPKEKLNQLKYAEPAIFACSLAALEKLKEERPWAIENCVATAGFGVGEITALAFAGALKFGDALKLVRTRAEAIELACEMAPGGMATVHYRADSRLKEALTKAKEWCLDRGIDDPQCQVAVYLNPNAKIIAGHKEALEFVESNVSKFKLKKVERVNVAGAFQTSLIKPAADTFRNVLDTIELSVPSTLAYSNVDCKAYRKLESIKKKLPQHMYKPMMWEQLIHKLFDRDRQYQYPQLVTCGPRGRALKEAVAEINIRASKHCIPVLN